MRKLIIASVSLATVVAAGFGAWASAAAGNLGVSKPAMHNGAAHTMSAPMFPANSKGETYGPAAGVSSVSSLPDLILVRADNGVMGYMTKSDFLGPTITPQIVKTWPTDSRRNYVEPSYVVPVYAQDGVTQVGVFTVQASQEGTPPTTVASPGPVATTTTIP